MSGTIDVVFVGSAGGATSLAHALEDGFSDVTVDRLQSAELANGRVARADALVIEPPSISDSSALFSTLAATDVPVVVYGDGSHASNFLDNGAVDFVHRAVDADVFAERVESAVTRRRNARRFESLFEDARRPIGIFDTDGRLVAVNDAAVGFSDVEREDLLGTRLWELPMTVRSSDDPAMARRLFGRAVDGDRVKYTTEVRDGEGAPRAMTLLFRPLWVDGVVDAVAVEAETIEGQPVDQVVDFDHRADGLAPLSRRLRTIVDNVPIVVFGFDADGTFTLSEGRGLERLGMEPGEAVGESVYDLFADYDDLLAAVDSALAGEHERAVHELDGVTFEAWYRPIVEDGAVTGVLGAAMDITELTDRERELKQFETIVKTVPDGVYVIDDEGVIVSANETAAEMVGYDRDSIVGERITELVADGVFDDDLLARYDDLVSQLLSSETDADHARIEFDVTLPDGEPRTFEGHVSLRPYDDQFRGTIGIIRDITDRKHQERELRRQNERLEEFASVVSHDLKNPLSVAQGLANLLAEEHDHAHLDSIQNSLGRMNELIDDLLLIARTGRTVTDPEPVSLATVATDAWSTVSAREATLSVELDQGREIAADRSRLRQLFENLYRNAAEHGGDDITVTVGLLDGESGFFVADDGPGIPEADRDAVFEHGFSEKPDGTGLGLSIVSEVAAAHGWTVSVTQSVAGGARFEIRDVHDLG